MVWYKEIGFKRNPLEVNPLKNREEPVGYDDEIDRMLYLVESGNTVLVEGPHGSGKTTLLAQIINKFGGKGRIIYVDGDTVNKRIDMSTLLTANQGMFRRLMKKRPKGMILLLDNARALPRKTYELLQYYFDQDYLKSIIFTTDNKNKLKFPASLFDRIGDRVIKTKPLSMEDSVELVLERLNQDVISKDKLEKIYILSDKNMATFLLNTSAVLEHMIENDKDDIDLKTLNKLIVKEPETADDEEVTACLDCGDKLAKVGEHHRCKNCDLYCPACGVLIDYDDYDCPNCGVQFEDEEDE